MAIFNQRGYFAYTIPLYLLPLLLYYTCTHVKKFKVHYLLYCTVLYCTVMRPAWKPSCTQFTAVRNMSNKVQEHYVLYRTVLFCAQAWEPSFTVNFHSEHVNKVEGTIFTAFSLLYLTVNVLKYIKYCLIMYCSVFLLPRIILQ